MTENNARPPLDWSGNAPFPFTRESSIKLDRDGFFWHEGIRVEHPGLARAMATWISRHPDNGRWVLENGYDWCYIAVEDVPLWVKSARFDNDAIVGTLSDGTEERIDINTMSVDTEGTLRCAVKPTARKGPYPAKLARHAQLALADRLREEGEKIFLGTVELNRER
jgi:uncharacterized protein